MAKVRNIIANGSKPHEFLGAERELAGEDTGYDNVTEMRNNARGLLDALGSIRGSLANPTLPALDSYVARTGFALRVKPLASLTDEHLCVGLEQQIGLDYLVPIALERLDTAPLVEARLYPGDLLDSLLNVPASFWDRRPDLRPLADDVAARGFSAAAALPETWQASVLSGLAESHARFGGTLPSRRWLRPEEGRAAPLKAPVP